MYKVYLKVFAPKIQNKVISSELRDSPVFNTKKEVDEYVNKNKKIITDNLTHEVERLFTKAFPDRKFYLVRLNIISEDNYDYNRVYQGHDIIVAYDEVDHAEFIQLWYSILSESAAKDFLEISSSEK